MIIDDYCWWHTLPCKAVNELEAGWRSWDHFDPTAFLLLKSEKGMVGSVRFGFVFQELVDFRFSVRFGSWKNNTQIGSVRFGF